MKYRYVLYIILLYYVIGIALGIKRLKLFKKILLKFNVKSVLVIPEITIGTFISSKVYNEITTDTKSICDARGIIFVVFSLQPLF